MCGSGLWHCYGLFLFFLRQIRGGCVGRGTLARYRQRRRGTAPSPEQPPQVIAEGLTPPAELIETAERAGLPTLASPQPAAEIIEVLRIYIAKVLAAHCTMHGVLMDVLGVSATARASPPCSKGTPAT